MAAAREEGYVELFVSDHAEEINKRVKGYNTAVDFPVLAETTPTERMYLEYNLHEPLEEREFVKLYVTTNATDNIVASKCKISIPYTMQNLKTGSISSGVLTADDFDILKAAGATGVPCTAGVKTLLGKYEVPAKQIFKLGNYTVQDGLDKSNGRLLIVLYDDTP